MNTYQLAKLASSFVLPLAEAIEDPDTEAGLLADLGFVLPPNISLVGGIRAAFEAIANIVIDLAEFDPDAGDSSLELLARMGLAFRSGMSSISNLAEGLDSAARNSPLVTATDVLEVVPRRLLDYLAIDFAQREFPLAYALLHTIGIIELRQLVQENDEHRVSFTERIVHWDELSRATSDPIGLMKERYGWDSATGVDTVSLFENLQELGLSLGLRSDFRAVDERARAAFDLALAGNGSVPSPITTKVLGVPLLPVPHATIGVELYPVGDASEHVDGFGIGVYADSQLATSIALTDWLSAEIHLEAFATGFGVVIRKGQDAKLVSALFDASPAIVLDNIALDASIAFVYVSPDSLPIVLLGSADATRVEVASIKLSAGLSKPPAGALEVYSEIALPKLTLVVKGSEGDGFLQNVLGDGFTVAFDLTVGFSTRRGLYLSGATGLEYSVSLALQAGPIFVDRVTLKLKSEGNKSIVTTSVVGGLALGPLVAVIEDIGLELRIDPSKPGILGNADLSLGFKPPSGVGLVVDAAGVSGGGFLAHDEVKQEYSGVLQLEFNDLALQAFGLITTQVAGGSGYSLLALIDADFPPVQLGWGFTLDGVGGLLAVNRCASTDALHAALKADTLSSILFPKNAITNAAQILSTLDAIFPTAAGRFLFGPMALIEWGTPTVFTAAIAVVIELPEPILIILIARLSVRLPSESEAMVRINLDALGVLDLSQDSLSLDAKLFDSKLLEFTLSGDMALRANWSSTSQREFLLAIGGFHPQFTPPAGFPALQRITIDMPSGPVSKLRLAAYLALTSNTVQFGATLDVFIGVSGYGLAGHLGFDALLQIDPFHFDADISGRVALTAGSDNLLAVSLDASLSGPAPWHIAGDFKIHIVFFDVGVSFSHTWGQDAPAPQIAPVQVLPLLTAALADARNWGAALPAGTSSLVSLKDAGSPVVHPLAGLEVHESVVPLGLAISRYGSATVSGANSFTILDYQVNGSSVNHVETIQDDFAPAQFFELSDAEKLARPSFERHDAGVRLKVETLATCGAAVAKTISYETYYEDQPGVLRTDPGTPPKPLVLGLAQVLAIGASGRAAIRTAGDLRYTAPGTPVRVLPQSFVIADRSSLSFAGLGTPQETYSAAAAVLQSALAQNPARCAALQIVSSHELVAT